MGAVLFQVRKVKGAFQYDDIEQRLEVCEGVSYVYMW